MYKSMLNSMKTATFMFVYLLLAIIICSKTANSQRKDIHHMMYETFKNAAMCFRILNGTNQFGCSTSQSGSTGVIHLVNNQEDVQWLLQSSKAGPYMAVVSPKLFIKDVMLKLNDSPHVSGVLLALDSSAGRPEHMSPDDTCPNRYASLAGSCNDSDPWNPFGSGFLLVDWKIPLFAVKDSAVLKQIEDCFNQFNLPLDESQVDRPLCSLQMTGHMFAAVDTPTCMRRNNYISSLNQITYCDPMGDQNLVSFLFPRQAYTAAPKGSVVLVTARMDAAAMFDGLAPGAITTVSALVTLLSTAHLLSQLLPQHKETYTKNIVFALLNGEAQEYIGSSRVVYDMQQGKFPSIEVPMLPEHLDQVIDLHQLDATKQIFCHCFKSSTAQNTVDMLMSTGKMFETKVEGTCSSTKLPPSSLHSFLKTNISIPGLVLTNHLGAYTNVYYNGLLDDSLNVAYQYGNGSQVPATGIQSSLAGISHTLALTLAQMVDNTVTWPTNITMATTSSLIDELLHCYLESRQCSIFHKVAGSSVVGDGEGPLPLYVGVSRAANQITSATYLTLANLTGRRNNLPEEQCSTSYFPSKMSNYSNVWIIGDQPDSGYCVETGLIYTPAVSPAFTIDNYNWTSGIYSTWTESVWQELSLRMFLRPHFRQELSTLILGLIVMFISFTSVYWISHNASQLFNPLPCDRC